MLEMPLPIKAAVQKAQEERPGEDVFEEARQRMEAALRQHGWLGDDGSMSSLHNSCWFITACKPE